jgi:hypothetical protein
MVHVEDNSVSLDGQPFVPQLPDVRIIEGKPYVSNKKKYIILEDVCCIMSRVMYLERTSCVYTKCV